MKQRLFSFYEMLVLRRPLVALLLSLLVIACLATNIPSFKLDASADALVLEGDSALKYSREISKRYATEDFLLVIFKPQKDMLSSPVLAKLDALRDQLVALNGVSSVVTILDVPLLQSPKISLDNLTADNIRSLRTPGIDIELVRAELKNSPLYESLLTSPDGQTTALQINLPRDATFYELLYSREALREQQQNGSLNLEQQQKLQDVEAQFSEYSMQHNEKQHELVEKVRVILADYRDDAQIYLGGVPMIAADMVSFVKSDLVIFGTGILLFIIATLTIIFRRFIWVALPLATCVLSAVFMLGLITWLDWRMTVISSNFVALLLIITLSITIHLVVRYRELLLTRPELDQQELVKLTVASMIKPCIYTSLTTMVAFASLVVSGIRPVIDFGWMMTLGVTAALVIVFIVIPCTLLLMKKQNNHHAGSDGVATTLRFASVTERHGKLILWVGGILAALSLLGVSRLEVENRFIDYFHESTEIYQGMEIIDAELGGTIPLEIIIDADLNNEPVISESSSDEGDSDEFADEFADEFTDDFGDDGGGVKSSAWFNRAGLTRIEQVHDYIDSLEVTGKVMSLATPYKVLRELSTGIDDIQLTLIQRNLPDIIRTAMIDPYLNEEIDQTRIVVRVMETSPDLHRAQLLIDIRDHLVNELGFKEEQIHLTGMLVLYNNMLQSLYRSQILTLGAVFIAIVLMFLVLFRSLSMALLAVAPNILAAGIVLGGMGLFGIPLDIMTVTIAAISVGIGVDNTIHYVHRFRVEFPKDQNYLATMYRCHGSIGKAMFYTSITIIIGFSVLALSNFTPSIYFGLLTGTAMFAALMGALLLLPKLIMTFKPLGPNVDVE
ncbi:MAG: MMPL family transporter [Spongiibacteraceae bacterium]|nr:MMPL family transporter [Spongiibacteraceae bacterium]